MSCNNDRGKAKVSIEESNETQSKRSVRRTPHTPEQITRMKEVFSKCSGLNINEREKLAEEIGLEPDQIKFWFQNQRTSLKKQGERLEWVQLTAENRQLRKENHMFREELKRFLCVGCTSGGLQMEHIQLKRERDRVYAITENFLRNPPAVGSGMQRIINGELVAVNEVHREIYMSAYLITDWVINLAKLAFEEFWVMTQVEEPLWEPCGSDGSVERLNSNVYSQTFPEIIGVKPNSWKIEASRDTIRVQLRPSQLVELLMNVNNYSMVFSNIVSTANVLDVISSSANYDGNLYVMTAEFHVPCPFVSTHQAYFLRYCKQSDTDTNTWAVMDVSLDGSLPIQITRCLRRPSGWLIKEMPDGSTMVTFLEHIEVEDNMNNEVISQSAFAFGAKRWSAALSRQCLHLTCEFIADFHPRDIVQNGLEGKRAILKLAERMVNDFYYCVTPSSSQTWTVLPGTQNDNPERPIRFMTQSKIVNAERTSFLLRVAASFKLLVPPTVLSKYLENMAYRNEWDMLVNGYDLEEIAHIAMGDCQQNCVSLLNAKSTNSDKKDWVILQESITDATGSLLVYSFVDASVMTMVCTGEKDEHVSLQPCGIAILPDQLSSGGDTNGSLLTISLQFEFEGVDGANIHTSSVLAPIENIVDQMIQSIKGALVP